MLRILFVFSLSNLYSQTTTLFLVDFLNKSPISNAIILKPTGEFITKSETDGSFLVDITIKEINVSANGYVSINIGPKDYSIINLKKTTISLEEVFVRNTKPIRVGFCSNKNNVRDNQSNSTITDYLVAATKININRKSYIQNYNYYIKLKENNSPFNFQIYSEKNGYPDKIIYNQYISNYKKGWNKTELEGVLNLEKGTYFIAMQWIPLPDKSDVWSIGEFNNKPVLVAGQALGLGDCNNENDSDFYYKKNWMSTKNSKFRKTSYAQYIEIYEN